MKCPSICQQPSHVVTAWSHLSSVSSEKFCIWSFPSLHISSRISFWYGSAKPTTCKRIFQTGPRTQDPCQEFSGKRQRLRTPSDAWFHLLVYFSGMVFLTPGIHCIETKTPLLLQGLFCLLQPPQVPLWVLLYDKSNFCWQVVIFAKVIFVNADRNSSAPLWLRKLLEGKTPW